MCAIRNVLWKLQPTSLQKRGKIRRNRCNNAKPILRHWVEKFYFDTV